MSVQRRLKVILSKQVARLREWMETWVQRRLKLILSKQSPERETELRKFAVELGCSLSDTYRGDGSKHLEAEVIRRIHEAARSIREARLWWIALISATASVVSALAAWCAVLSKW